jgi:3-dehydroquinate dehydratase-2
MTSKFLVINGPNLNLLGTREPHIYGDMSLADIAKYTEKKLSEFDVQIEWFQTNIEGEIVDKVQKAGQGDYKALIINPAAYSHTSVAILDALKMLTIPKIEVHLSNTNLREEFRSNKLTAKASTSLLEGFGKDGYYLAIYSQLME